MRGWIVNTASIRGLTDAGRTGIVHTQYLDKNVPLELKESWIGLTPMKQLVDIEELAEIYLLLSTSRTMTGAVIVADCGYSLLNR